VPIIEELRNIVKIHEATIKTLQEEKQSLEAQVADLLNPKPKPRKPRS
jgi:cell division protein FtsB